MIIYWQEGFGECGCKVFISESLSTIFFPGIEAFCHPYETTPSTSYHRRYPRILISSIRLSWTWRLFCTLECGFFFLRPAGAFYKSREGMMMLQRRELLVPFHTEPSGELPECYSDILFLCMSKSGTFLRSNCSLVKEMWVPCHVIHDDLCDSNLQSATWFPSTGIQ